MLGARGMEREVDQPSAKASVRVLATDRISEVLISVMIRTPT